jgi:replication factor A1
MTESQIDKTADRIIDLFATHNVKLQRADVVGKLTELMHDFGLPQQEAERTVGQIYARAHNVTIQFRATDAGTKPIGDLTPGEWVTVEGRIISAIRPVGNKSIFQMGVIADATGSIAFTAWARNKNNKNDVPLEEMQVGQWYRIANAIVDEYQGAASLKIPRTTVVGPMTDQGPVTPVLTPVDEIKPGIVSVKAKVVRLFTPSSDKIRQTGILGDETGTVKFTIWESEAPTMTLEEGKAYAFHYAKCTVYNDKNDLTLTPQIIPVTDVIAVKSGKTTRSGAIVQVRQNSGLIKRCPVEGCGKPLSRMNYCPVHEVQNNFVYDLRIRAVFDDGHETLTLTIPKEAVERLTGMELDDAVHLATTTPIGFDEVFMRFKKMLTGRYVTVSGTLYDDSMFVTDCTFMTLAQMQDQIKMATVPQQTGETMAHE